MSTESRIPRILEQAPDFKAKSTHGVIQLSDYTSKGKYVLLFSTLRTSLPCAPRSSLNLRAEPKTLRG